MGVPLSGPINVTVNCCDRIPGTYPPDIAPYVVSLNSLSGILTLAADGGVAIRSEGGTIYIGADGTAGLGTVTSVNATSDNTNLTVSGGPITTAGSLALSLAGNLGSISELNMAANQMIYSTGSESFDTADLTVFARTLLDDANAAAARSTLGLVIGTNVQAFSQDLTDFVTNATWTGANLSLAGDLTAAGTGSFNDISVVTQIDMGGGDIVSGGDATFVNVTATTLIGAGGSITSLNMDNAASGTLAVGRGGTGLASFAIGDLIYASGTTTLSRRADVATGNVLLSGGVGVAPLYGKVTTAHTTGIAASGGNADITAMSALAEVSSNVEFQGGVEFQATVKDVNSSAGVSGQLLKSIGTAAEWTDDIVADTLRIDGTLSTEGTITGAGTTGAQTINKLSGTCRFAAAATSLVITNSICTTSHRVLATVVTNDTTLKSVSAVPSTGAFTLNANAAATAETEVFWMLVGIT